MGKEWRGYGLTIVAPPFLFPLIKMKTEEIFDAKARRDRDALRLTRYMVEKAERHEFQLAHRRSELANHLCGRVIRFDGSYWLCTDEKLKIVNIHPTPGVISIMPVHNNFEFVGTWMEWIELMNKK